LATLPAEALLVEAAKALCETHRALVAVCDRDDAMVGVMSKTDVVRQVARSPKAVNDIRIESVMTRDVVFCRLVDSLDDVLALMTKKGFVHLPIVDGSSRPVGVVNARDALQSLLSALRDEELLLQAYVMGVGYR
jgi:CBS domain-containing protein